MAVNCGVSFGVCAVRLTKVDCNGNVVAGSTNSYVTDKLISIGLSPNIETGTTFSLRSGCGCSISRFRGEDIFNWFEFTIAAGGLEPEMLALMLNAETIVDGADIVGLAFPSESESCDPCSDSVALEFWTKHIVGSGQDGIHPWIHWVFPMSVWQMGDNTAEEDFLQTALTGFSRTNTQWGDGPYGDGPPDGQDIREGGWWKTDVDPPTASCAGGSVTATS